MQSTVSTTATKFRTGLYLEHLEEASFLYEQHLGLLNDPEVTWLERADFEERIAAHIDALVLGGPLALSVCEQQTEEGDFGERYAAVRVFCRHHRWDLIPKTFDGVEPDDDESIQAVGDALCLDVPLDWEARFVEVLSRGTVVHQRIAAHLIGYRRIAAGSHLLALLDSEVPVLRRVVWALGRLRYIPARAPLYERCLQHEDSSIREAAALALLRMGEAQTLSYCAIYAHAQPWTHLCIGLGGTRTALDTLRNLFAIDHPAVETLQALGLLGECSIVQALMYSLGEEPLAEAAAVALQLLTGADLYEEVFIPDEVDEDELFEEERERWQRGEPPEAPGAPPPGEMVVRLSQSLETWQAWWNANQSRFQLGIRYRRGQPCTPAALLADLTADTALHAVRRWAYEELVIRYGMDLPFDADGPVAEQQQALAQIAAWVAARGPAFREGKWYFAGAATA